MTTLLKRVASTLRDWLASTTLEPLTPAHGWLLPDARPVLVRNPVPVTVASSRLRS